MNINNIFFLPFDKVIIYFLNPLLLFFLVIFHILILFDARNWYVVLLPILPFVIKFHNPMRHFHFFWIYIHLLFLLLLMIQLHLLNFLHIQLYLIKIYLLIHLFHLNILLQLMIMPIHLLIIRFNYITFFS